MARTRSIERRFTKGEVEIRAKGDHSVIEGHAAVFDSVSENLGGFVEVVKRGAFTKTLNEADVRALYNHDENLVLGRSKSGTLRMSQDESGLYYEIDPPDTTYANDLRKVMERGDVNQSSFAFFTVQDDWGFLSGTDSPMRSLIEVGLVDVSPVTYPAYLAADSGVRRSAVEGLAKRNHVNPADLDSPDAIAAAIRGTFTPVDSGRRDTPDPTWQRRAHMLSEMEKALRFVG
jgi:HK97 family phage prohead protease